MPAFFIIQPDFFVVTPMFKPVLFFTAVLTLSPLTQAELTFSEKIRPTVKSAVNPAYQRFEIPPTPHNMNLPSFGKGVVGWGSGPDDAKARLDNVTRADVQIMKAKGTTLEMAQAWQAFYDNETLRNPGNPTAPFRAQLMKKIVSLW